MRKWFAIWWPPVFGLLMTGIGASATAACIAGAHWYMLGPIVAGTSMAFIGTVFDVARYPSGPSQRDSAYGTVCVDCIRKDRAIAGVTKDRDELHQALLALEPERVK